MCNKHIFCFTVDWKLLKLIITMFLGPLEFPLQSCVEEWDNILYETEKILMNSVSHFINTYNKRLLL